MNPIFGERGKLYYAIECPNCQEVLLLMEYPPEDGVKAKFQNLSIRCPSCTQETPLSRTQMFVREIR